MNARFRSDPEQHGQSAPPARLPRRAATSHTFLSFAPAVIGGLCLLILALLVEDQWLPGDSAALHFATATLLAVMLVTIFGLHRAMRAVPGGEEALSEGSIAALTRERDAAEAASAAKSRYLANVSHEIRSPLNAIYGYAQLVEHEAGVNPQEAAKVIRRSAEHLTNLVDGLLDISLVENGVLRVNTEVVRLPSFIEQVASMFRPSATVKGLAFRCELPERLPEFVRTDPRRLRQTLINLLSNAIKFTDQGTVTLAVTWSGEMATFEVRDTGPGIAEDARERIFAPFERNDGGHRPQQGAGLGLPITRAIVQILGGDLELDSALGQGSCFRVRLMLPHVAGYCDTAVPLPRILGYEGPRRTILVADDDAGQLALMRRVLEGIGFEVALAPDGHTALALCEAGSFDLALLDLAMPGISGWDTAEHLRAVHGSALRIVMLSANAHERHGRDGVQQDHDLFLLKPVELAALVDALGDQLGLVWVRDEAESFAAPGGEAAAQAALSPVAHAHVEKLRELLRIGHVRGIEAEIRSLEAAAPEAQGLIAALYDCLDRFDLAALGRTLEGL